MYLCLAAITAVARAETQRTEHADLSVSAGLECVVTTDCHCPADGVTSATGCLRGCIAGCHARARSSVVQVTFPKGRYVWCAKPHPQQRAERSAGIVSLSHWGSWRLSPSHRQ